MRFRPILVLALLAACKSPPRSSYVPGGAGLPKQAREDYRRALDEERAGKVEEALATLADLCSRHPTRLAFHLRRLRLAHRAWGGARAAALYQPPPPGVDRARAEILVRLAWIDATTLADRKEAIDFAIEREPDEPYWHLALADIALTRLDAVEERADEAKRRGRTRKAEEIEKEVAAQFERVLAHARRALELDPRFAEAHLMIGYAQARRADRTKLVEKKDKLREAAEASYSAALKLDFELLPALLNRAEIRLALDRFDPAGEDLVAASKLAPGDPVVWSSLGAFYFKLGRAGAALDAYEKALELEPKAARSRAALADCLVAENRNKKAIQQFVQARADAPDDHKLQAEIAFKLGALYEFQRHYREAVQEYELHITHAKQGGLPSSSVSKARSRIRHIVDHAFE